MILLVDMYVCDMWHVCVILDEFVNAQQKRKHPRECVRVCWCIRDMAFSFSHGSFIHPYSMFGHITTGDRDRTGVVSWACAQPVRRSLVMSLGVAARCAEVAAPSAFEVGDALAPCHALAWLFAFLQTSKFPPRALEEHLAAVNIACSIIPDIHPCAHWT